jgi:hypothetical protein
MDSFSTPKHRVKKGRKVDRKHPDAGWTNTARSASRDSETMFDDDSAPIAGEIPPRIPAGEYQAFCYQYELEPRKTWGKHHVYILFRICGDRCGGTELFLACPYFRKGEMSHRYKYFQQWTIANGAPPVKGQRMTPNIFLGKMFKVLIRDARTTYPDGEPTPESLRYSVVHRIIGLVTLEDEP